MSENDYRPKGWSPKNIPTIWVDHTTGQGVTGDGTSVKPKIGDRRKNPNLADLLDTAASYGAERVMLTGKVPEPAPGVRHWLLVQTPNWKADGHWLTSPGVTGRFVHKTTGQKVQLRFVAEWFGPLALTPAQARSAWDTTAAILRSIDDRATMFLTPGMTGTNLWAWSLPRNVNPVPVSADIADELHLTSGQHHLEHLVAGPNFSSHADCVPLIDPAKTPKIQTFAHTDGRFMYAALGRELGIGPGVRLNRAAAYELLQSDPYARARYEVKFTVPKDWNHVGLLGVRHENSPQKEWYYPNRPGASAVTWADASEIAVALLHNWTIDPLQAVVFQKARPMDTFAERITRAREKLAANEELPAPLRRAVGAALRSILIQSIGALATRGRETTQVVTSAFDVPEEFRGSVVRHGELFIYRTPSQQTERNKAFYHPEIAVQIWGRGRARVLSAPTAQDKRGGGALAVAPHTLIGINGDAIYTTATPPWALPVEYGGGDDGKTGKLRLQGVITGSFITPATLDARAKLADRAGKAGPSGAWTPTEPGEGN